MSDWNHRSAFQDFYIELGNPLAHPVVPGATPRVDSVVFDGVGRCVSAVESHCADRLEGNYTNCTSTDPLCVPAKDRKPIFSRVFQKGKRYLIRLINSSHESGFIFSIDNHMLEIVTTDLVPIHPFKNESIQVNIGENISLRVRAV